eukprot:TRINITY_DN2934_c0_g1_i3.p1 TRINITY_DN2934_c0_g1~~TRINITY_DN2934_c0_g1_i3.p1  ORF type:complete len:167 (-),score=26.91 TRINITY_DN2934_c0_g1_i3:78-578(-)
MYRTKQWDLVFNVRPFLFFLPSHYSTKKGNRNQLSQEECTIREECGPKLFLDLCLVLVSSNITGPRIWWSFEYCGEDSIVFVRKVTDRDPDLIDYIEKQAKLYMCFPGNDLLKNEEIHIKEQLSRGEEDPGKTFVLPKAELFVDVFQFFFIFLVGLYVLDWNGNFN